MINGTVFTNDEIDGFCRANGVESDAQVAAVHDAVRAMEKAEGKLALVRMQESEAEELKRFLGALPEDTYRDDELEEKLRHGAALTAAQKMYEHALCNQTLRTVLQVIFEMDYSRKECAQIEAAARQRMELKP